MARKEIGNDNSKELKQELKKQVIQELELAFLTYLEESNNNIELSKINILNDKSDIISKVSYNIFNTKENNNQYRYKYEGIFTREFIANLIDDNFFKEYNKFFKGYTLKQKAQQEYFKNVLYDYLSSEIKRAIQNKYNIDTCLQIIKTPEYKNEVYQNFKSYYNINEDLFNKIYLSIRNKVLNEYKDIMQQDEANNKKSPLASFSVACLSIAAIARYFNKKH